MNRKKAVIAAAIAGAVLLLLVAGRGLGLWGGSTALKLYGNVDIREVELGFRVGGRIAAMPVEEGEAVTEGTVLARLDAQPLQDALSAADARLDASSAELEKLERGNRPQDIARANALVTERQAALAAAGEDFNRRKALIATGAISQAVFDKTRADYLAAKAQLAEAEQALSLQRAGARTEDVAAGRAQRNTALAERSRARTDLDDATLTAPAAGVILTRAREPGAIVQPGETVFTLAITRPVRVRAYVAEADLGRIAPGMAVRIKTDSSDRLYRGTIGYISPTAEFTPKSVQTEDLRTDLVYHLRIIVTDADDALRQGQPVTVLAEGAAPPARR